MFHKFQNSFGERLFLKAANWEEIGNEEFILYKNLCIIFVEFCAIRFYFNNEVVWYFVVYTGPEGK